jgi:hypothetical protein
MINQINDLKNTINTLLGHAVTAKHHWQTYRTMYGDNSNVDLLNETASEFFGWEQDRLTVTSVIFLCRLLDPASMGSNDNLTLLFLCDLLDSQSPGAACDNLRSRVTDLKAKAKPILDARNKRIAHLDRAVLLANYPTLGFKVELYDWAVNEILEALNEACSIANQPTLNTQESEQYVQSDVETLLCRLKATARMDHVELRQKIDEYDAHATNQA